MSKVPEHAKHLWKRKHAKSCPRRVMDESDHATQELACSCGLLQLRQAAKAEAADRRLVLEEDAASAYIARHVKLATGRFTKASVLRRMESAFLAGFRAGLRRVDHA